MRLLWLSAVVTFFVSSKAQSGCGPAPLDIVLVIDKTNSVGRRNYNTTLDAVKNLISSYHVSEDGTHIAIVTFAGKAEVRANLNYSNNQRKLLDLIDNMKANDILSSPTRTDLALQAVSTHVFVAANGDRPGVPNAMVVFTDGGKSSNSKSYSVVLQPLEEKGVHRIAVGIGRRIKQEELVIIAGDKKRVVRAASFADLNNQLKAISSITCNVDGGYTEWSSWSDCSKTCGGGIRWRFRNCTNPPPMNNGISCVEQGLGAPEEMDECNDDECQPMCEIPPLDLALVIDKTKSIGKDNYVSMLDFVEMLISKFEVGKDKTHIAIVTFAGEAEARANLNDSRYHSRQGLHDLLDDMKKKDKLSSPTRPDKALRFVNEKVFNVKYGDRANVPDIMLMLTDGGKIFKPDPNGEILPQLDVKGVYRIAIGFGRQIREDRLMEIAGECGQILKTKNLDSLFEEVDKIRGFACAINGEIVTINGVPTINGQPVEILNGVPTINGQPVEANPCKSRTVRGVLN